MANTRDIIIGAGLYAGKKLVYNAMHPINFAVLTVAYTYGGIPYAGAWALYNIIT